LGSVFTAGPVFNGPPSELYPGRRANLMLVAGGMTTISWTLAPDAPDAPDAPGDEAPLTGAADEVDPTGFVHALCLDAIPERWAGRAVELRLVATDQSGVARETTTRFWVGDPASPCDGTPRPVPADPADPAGPAVPSVTGPAEVALGEAARFRLHTDPADEQAPSFGVTVPATQIYAGIPTGGPLIGDGTTFELCLRPLDPDAVGRHFEVFLGALGAPGAASSPFVVAPPAGPSAPVDDGTPTA
jgi:hypothetical protein